MSIAELIMQGTNRASDSTAWVGDSLAKLGQNVGQALAQREQQKQAQEMLPFLQQNMQDAMELAGQGDTAGAYSKMIPFLTDPSVARNPFVNLPALVKGVEIAADDFFKKSQIEAYKTRYGRGGIPAMTPADKSSAMLKPPTTTYGGQVDGTMTPEEMQVDSQGYPAQISPSGEPLVALPTNEPTGAEVTSEQSFEITPDQYENTLKEGRIELLKLAKGVNTKELKSALEGKAKNPPSIEELQSFRKSIEQFKRLPEPQKKSVMREFTVTAEDSESLSNAIAAEQKANEGSTFFNLPNADKILGPGYKGIILSPSTETKGFTAKGEPIIGYDVTRDDVRKNYNLINSQIQELNSGKLGSFIRGNGGIFNLDLESVEEKVAKEIEGVEIGEGRIVNVNYLYNKNDPEKRIKVTEPQAKVFQSLDTLPGQIISLNETGAYSKLVQIAPVSGPTARYAKGLPAMQQQPTPEKKERFPVKSK